MATNLKPALVVLASDAPFAFLHFELCVVFAWESGNEIDCKQQTTQPQSPVLRILRRAGRGNYLLARAREILLIKVFES